MIFEQELDTFRRKLPDLLQDPNKSGLFVLIHGDVVDSFWPSQEEGLQAGYERFGLDPFLIKRVVEREEPEFFSRRVRPCPL